MTIFLRQTLTERLVIERYGSVEGLVGAWEDLIVDATEFPRPRQRASVYRWISKGVPTLKGGSDHSYFGICGLLDADPLVLFDFERNGYFSRFARIRQLIYFGRKSLGGIATMLEMYRPADHWPSDIIAKKCFGRAWSCHHFTNQENWKNTDYVLLKASFADYSHGLPRAVHIAYRRLGVPDTMWRYYGTVLAIDGQLELYSESGTFQKMPQVVENEIRFRTYFGGRPVEWRVASLHDFALQSEFPFNDESTIGFTW